MCGMLSVMNGKSVFPNVLANVDIREISLYEVPMLLPLFGFGIGMRSDICVECECVELCDEVESKIKGQAVLSV